MHQWRLQLSLRSILHQQRKTFYSKRNQGPPKSTPLSFQRGYGDFMNPFPISDLRIILNSLMFLTKFRFPSQRELREVFQSAKWHLKKPKDQKLTAGSHHINQTRRYTLPSQSTSVKRICGRAYFSHSCAHPCARLPHVFVYGSSCLKIWSHFSHRTRPDTVKSYFSQKITAGCMTASPCLLIWGVWESTKNHWHGKSLDQSS